MTVGFRSFRARLLTLVLALLAGVLARGFPLVLAVLPREFDSIKQFYDRPRGTQV